MNNQNIVCPSCGSLPNLRKIWQDGGSALCSNETCGKTFHYEFLCPSCGSKAIKGLIRKDGGSSICSNENCGRIFHYCQKTKKIEHTIPISCCYSL